MKRNARFFLLMSTVVAFIPFVIIFVDQFHSAVAKPLTQGKPPIIPARIFGIAQVAGQNAPTGSQITAAINGTIYATVTITTTNNTSVYTVEVPGDDPTTDNVVEGGREGDTIIFAINGVRANENATWHSGALMELNLTTSATPTPITPTVIVVTPMPITPIITVTATPRPSTPISIPEPITVILFGTGLASLTAWGASRMRKYR